MNKNLTNTINWLLENENPGVRFLALKNIKKLKENDPELVEARKDAYTKGPIGKYLDKMNPEGYWVKPGGGYGPKYRSTVWSLISLGQLGASAKHDKRIEIACKYYLDHACSKEFSIAYNGNPGGTIYCLAGNMLAALTDLEFEDPRLPKIYEWLAKAIIGKETKYYAYLCGPTFACGANDKKPCAWGAIKALMALAKLPERQKTPSIKEAINVGIEFLLSVDPNTAKYPTRENLAPNRSWWKFGFPVFYISDVLQIAESLVLAGAGRDKRLENTLDYISGKQDKDGKWLLEYDYTGKTWFNVGPKKQPNKWVTYRVLKVLNDC